MRKENICAEIGRNGRTRIPDIRDVKMHVRFSIVL